MQSFTNISTPESIEGIQDVASSLRGTTGIRNAVLLKYQTLGNSYLIFDPNRNQLENVRLDLAPDWIKAICDRDYGIGSNGLLVGPDNGVSGAFEFRVFNSDGSQAQLSGNGARIFARYVLDAKYVAPADRSRFSIAAISRELDRIAIEVSTDEAMGSSITTTIKTVPSLGPCAVGAYSGVTFGGDFSVTVAALADVGRRNGPRGSFWSDSTMLSIGNPHCVTFVPAYDMLPSFDLLKRLKNELSLIADSPALGSTNPAFSEGCNLQWCFVESRQRLHLRIVERGEGPTLASGSSAAAAVIAAFVRGLVDRRVTASMPGGNLILVLSICNNEIVAIEISGEARCVAEIRMVDAGGGAGLVQTAAARR